MREPASGPASPAGIRYIVFLLAGLSWMPAPQRAAGQEMTIYSVDVYGAWNVSPQEVLAAFGLRAGDSVDFDRDEAAKRVRALDGVDDVQISTIRTAEGVSVFVGVTEEGAPKPERRPEPEGTARVPDDIHEHVDALQDQLERAARAGVYEEDGSQGHALSAYPAARVHQLSLVPLATEHLEALRTVLRESRFVSERRAAALAIAYAEDKRTIVPDLIFATSDPDEEVRSTALAALALIAGYSNENPELRITVDPRPFVRLLDSPVWNDRNEAAAVLVSLTQTRDERLLNLLRDESLPALYEMALWHTGHAIPPVLILGRIAGLDDARVIQTSYERRNDRAAYEAWIEVLTRRATGGS